MCTYLTISKDLMRDLDVYGVRQYFRCMFRALRDIHSRGIMHRDLKPANFLFDPIENTGTMVDFGLAEVCALPLFNTCP
jgi:cell division control protein 7